jgi:polyferredoxin
MKNRNYPAWKEVGLPLSVFAFTAFLLSMVQLNLDTEIILLDRFIEHGGWIEIPVISFYGAFIAWKMQDVNQSGRWRRISWTVFSVVFFAQLGLGLMGFEKFLMTGELHLPVPMMILGGPVYRLELSIMSFLFLSTLLITGPAWCSHLCYFGAMDNLVAQGNPTVRRKISHLFRMKFLVLFLVIAVAILLRWFGISLLISTLLAAGFGIAGIVIILTRTRKKGRMVHCLSWCPIGTLVNYGKHINPFRMYIESDCTLCMQCSGVCKYDALGGEDIKRGKPGLTCTYCGDCLSSCHQSSIKYKLFGLSPGKSRNIYLFLTISMHAIFLAMGRI